MNNSGYNSLFSKVMGFAAEPSDMAQLNAQQKARLLYEYGIASKRKVSETVHNLFIIAEHYAEESPIDLTNPTVINGIPSFFENLTAEQKADYCYNQVTEGLSLEVLPVTVESLRATKRAEPNNPWSSYAGRFVRRVTIYVSISVSVLVVLWHLQLLNEVEEIRWVAFGCLGSLLHLLNHALTTTRQQTFELSESRKIWPRLLLGGMLGFVLPWILREANVEAFTNGNAVGSIAAFFAGYSVRFATGLLERVLKAVFPDTKPT
jgi:hypothetical protein